MFRSALLAAMTALALACPAAHATSFSGQNPDSTALYAQWIHESKVPTANISITIDPRNCSTTVAACYNPKRRVLFFADTSYLWTESVFASDDRDRSLVHALFMHEMGHVRDLLPRRSHRYRLRFLRIIGVHNYAKPNPWIALVSYHGFAVDPKELFAMAFEFCALDTRGPQTAEWAQGYGYAPTVDQHRQVCDMLSRPLR